MKESNVSTNPHAAHKTSLMELAKSLKKNQQLIVQMTKREVIGRYQGSAIGMAWSFLNPILMLIVFTFVFSEIFKSRWGGIGGDDSKTQFAMVLFVGMIILNLFSEVLNRAPNLIISNVNYVKKVVFPIEILAVIAMGAALFHAFASLSVLILAMIVLNGAVQWTIIFLPIVILPLIILALGIAWMLASLGVFIRDVGQTIGIVTSVLMFLSPITYPISAVPERFRPLMMLNPLTFIIEQSREVLIWGNIPNFLGLLQYSAISIILLWAGFSWFQKTRKGFADVL